MESFNGGYGEKIFFNLCGCFSSEERDWKELNF
jgi:hypothetical protein